jgi:hypothetical protein
MIIAFDDFDPDLTAFRYGEYTAVLNLVRYTLRSRSQIWQGFRVLCCTSRDLEALYQTVDELDGVCISPY